MPDRLDIVETLYRFDEPMLFVARVGTLQALFLKTDESDYGNEFLSCYVDNDHIEGLKEGRISIRGVYEAQKDLTLVLTDFEYEVTKFQAFDRKDPEIAERLPEPGVGILPRMGECPDVLQEKDALLSVYFKGMGLERDRIAYSTLMDLLGKVQRFAKNFIAPPELRGLRSTTFDFTVGDPALGSLMISIKEPEFDIAKLRQNEKRKNITPGELAEGVYRQKEELFSEIESLSRARRGAANASDAYYSVKDLLPTETSPHQSVMFSTSDGAGFRAVSIDTRTAERYRNDFEARDWQRATRAGSIIEINAGSATCLLQSRLYRVTTCAFDGETFERLERQREFKIGSSMTVSGDLLKRPRRDYMNVHNVDNLQLPG